MHPYARANLEYSMYPEHTDTQSRAGGADCMGRHRRGRQRYEQVLVHLRSSYSSDNSEKQLCGAGEMAQWEGICLRVSTRP